MAVLPYRRNEGGGINTGDRFINMVAFFGAPAVIAAFNNQVDLLVLVLSDIGCP